MARTDRIGAIAAGRAVRAGAGTTSGGRDDPRPRVAPSDRRDRCSAGLPVERRALEGSTGPSAPARAEDCQRLTRAPMGSACWTEVCRRRNSGVGRDVCRRRRGRRLDHISRRSRVLSRRDRWGCIRSHDQATQSGGDQHGAADDGGPGRQSCGSHGETSVPPKQTMLRAPWPEAMSVNAFSTSSIPIRRVTSASRSSRPRRASSARTGMSRAGSLAP